MTTPGHGSPVRILHCSDGIAVGEVGPVCIALWRRAVVKARFERQAKGLAEVVHRHRGEVGFLCVVEPSVDPPNDELRQASVDMLALYRSDLKCVACVIEGTGFRAAIARGVVAGMSLLRREREIPISFFRSVGEAESWMQKHIGHGWWNLAACVERMRTLLEP